MSVREFDGVTSFALHLVEASVALHALEHKALDAAAKVIEDDAKGQVGEYQDAAGPFSAWAPLAESTKEDRVRHGFPEDEPLLRTGALRDSISREVAGSDAAVGSDSDVMVYQELGTSKMPPRPVLGPAAFKNQDKIEEILGRAVVHAMEYGAAGSFVALPE